MNLTADEILEEKRSTIRSKGFKFIMEDDILPTLNALRDQLDNLSNGRNIDNVVLQDAEVKGQIFQLKQIMDTFNKYRK